MSWASGFTMKLWKFLCPIWRQKIKLSTNIAYTLKINTAEVTKFCVIFVPSEHGIRGCFSTLLVQKTNGWSEITVSSALTANRKIHQNGKLHVRSINFLCSPFGLGQPLRESIAWTWMTSREWRWCLKVEWEMSANGVKSLPLTDSSCFWGTMEMDRRRQEEVIYFRNLFSRNIAEVKW